MKIEIQRTDWMEGVYNKIKASEDGRYLFKIFTNRVYENNTVECKTSDVIYNIYKGLYILSWSKDRYTVNTNIKIISNILEQFINNVTPLFLDSVTSLSYTDTQAKAYIENVQKIKGWYDKGLFGEIVSKFPVGAPQQIPQAHQL
jgi:hypothetical protein